MHEDIQLELASIIHAEAICDLINLAYRGSSGWTKETQIISGNRSHLDEIKALILNKDSHLLIAIKQQKIIACICIEMKSHQAYIGSFAVDPNNQNKGVGKFVLQYAEQYAIDRLQAIELVMVVICQRIELIAFYERRGYQRTGKIESYPVHLNVGIPIIEGLTIETLSKKVIYPIKYMTGTITL